MVVWIDHRSASASEVLASALHDNCRAVLFGENSFGKGLIQGVFGLADGNGIIITVAKYETPAGDDINGKGVSPDVLGDVGKTWLGVVTTSPDPEMREEVWTMARERLGGALCKSAAH